MLIMDRLMCVKKIRELQSKRRERVLCTGHRSDGEHAQGACRACEGMWDGPDCYDAVSGSVLLRTVRAAEYRVLGDEPE